MSAMANTTPLVTTVTKPATNPRDADTAPRVKIHEFCEEYYEDILPIIMDKVRSDRRKDVHTRLDFGKGHRRQSAFDRLSETYSPSTTKSKPRRTDSRDHPQGRSRPHRLDTLNDCPKDRERFRSVGESYDDSFSHSYRNGNRSLHMKRRRDNESPLSSMCEEEDPFTPRIRKFESSQRTRMPNNVKTYDLTGDLEDHVKIFQAVAQVKQWAMPTWCHMFNSTLIGAGRVWFDELPPESIDSYKDLKAAFLAYFMQQKKYVKDPVEIHNIKQQDGETIEDFMERLKVETGGMKGAPECMRISGFMHGVNNSGLTKRLNELVLKIMEEMMIATTAFIRGEAAATSKKKGHTSWKAHDQSKRQTSDKRSDLRGHSREGRGSNRFTPLTRTPKEILAAEAGKFQPPPPMVTPVEKRSSSKFCDFHNDKWHSMDESEIGGHMIHRIYVDDGSSMEILYEHCFNQLRLEIKSQMVSATTSLTGFSSETIWPLGQLRLLEVAIGGMISDKGLIELCSILKKNLDVFAWQPSDMTGVPRSVAEHRLNIQEGYSPVRQKKRGQAPERAKAIQAEVQKLVEAGIMREVYYHDWLSNLVMIQLAEPDEEKTTFHTGQGVYYYTKMPFGLKNAGATYQRLMDKDFESQIGQNIEVYVDDLVVKGYTEAEMLRDIEETFRTLRKINMKLKPKKCAFGLAEGVFLGYVVTPEGIKSCPDKTAAVLQLPSPRTIKEVQILNGKLAILNRFLSKSAEKPRMSVEGQILADFLIEMPYENPQAAPVVETQQEPWILFMDGSSCVDGSASNNEAEYEALITGLRIAAHMEVKNVHVSVDSKLVANQVLGTYVAKEDNMVKYLDKVKILVSGFTNFLISQVPRSKNQKADALSKIVSTSFAYLSKQAEYVIREIHEGLCSMHAGPRSVVAKAIWLGYYRPTMHRDARDMIRKCNDCQIHHPITRSPHQPLTSIRAPWPFYKWGIDIAGPFPEGSSKVKFLIVAMDYFTKWIEAKAVATITGGQVKKFVWDNIVCRFGLPGEIVSDNGKQFSDNPFKDWCDKLNITQRFASVKHPQSNGLVERANKSLGEEIKACLEIGMPTYRTVAVDVASNDEELRLNLDPLEQLRERAAICEAKAKSKMTKYYNARVRGVTFRPGDFVYRSNDASHAVAGGKLGPKWEGPYEVI
nr:reverse transcriptase domain-containing protein [Tanacetum cinerariifolium]